MNEAVLAEICSSFGITRIARLTEFGEPGVEIISTVRPVSSDVIRVYSGKGKSLRQAVLSAIMECLERTVSNWSNNEVRLESERSLSATGDAYMSPSRFSENLDSAWSPDTQMPWVRTEATGGEIIWAPADLVFWGTDRPDYPAVFANVTTNGLAAHFLEAEAVAKGRRELIERHVVSEIDLSSGDRDLKQLLALSSAMQISPGQWVGRFRHRSDEALDLVPASGSFADDVCGRFRARGIAMHLKHLGTHGGLYIVACGSTQVTLGGMRISCAGYGAQSNLSMAIEDAVLEMCQSRATDLHGAREDCGLDDKRRSLQQDQGHWLLNRSENQVQEADLPAHASSDGLADDFLFHRFRSPSELAIVRVLCPGLQTWHATAGESRDMA